MTQITHDQYSEIFEICDAMSEVATLLQNQKTLIEVCAITYSSEDMHETFSQFYVAQVATFEECHYDINEAFDVIRNNEALSIVYYKLDDIDAVRALLLSHVAQIEAQVA